MAPKTLRVCHINARSLSAPSRLLDFEILTANHSIDILCITETWLTAHKPSTQYLIPGFQPPFRRDRPTGPGGGVAVYVRSSLHTSPVQLPPSISIECLSLSIRLSKKTKLSIITAYRPPASNHEDFSAQLSQVTDISLSLKPTALCIAGDFNAKTAEWYHKQKTDSPGKHLYNFSISHNLTQVISQPTYGLHTDSPSLLDLMFIDKPHLVKHASVLSPITDHCPTIVQLQMRGQPIFKPSSSFSWDYDNADFDGLRSALATIDWSPVLTSDDVDQTVTSWSTQFLQVLHQHVPLKKHCHRPGSKPWYSPFLRKLAKFKDRLFLKSRGCAADSTEVLSFKKARNWYVSELRKAEHLFYRSLQARFPANSQRWWSKLKRAVSWSPKHSIPPLSSASCLHLSPVEKAETLNNMFSSQCSVPPMDSSPTLPQPTLSFNFPMITEDVIQKSLCDLNVMKSAGLDKLSNRILKESAKYIAAPLLHIFNLSLTSGTFPKQWKVAKISPVYKKKGSQSDPSNYRPISLLCSVSKVFESLIKTHLLNFCQSNQVLPPEQYGFLPGRSTTWQLLSLLEDFYDSIDNRNHVHALFLDVSKAFDRVDHSLLLKKCSSIGLSDQSCQWLASYLKDRFIITYVDGQASSPLPTSSGVPQGSVLGPLLFLIYFSSLPNSIETSSSSMFADDTLVYNLNCSYYAKPDTHTCCTLQLDVDRVSNWAKVWNTTFNATKSANIVFGRALKEDGQVPALSLDGTPVPRCTSTRHLGLTLTSSLQWSVHIDQLIHSVGWKVCLLKRLAFSARLPLRTLSHLYCSLIRPSLEYASCAWDNCLTSDSNLLERLQLSLARSFLSSQLGSPTVSAFSKCDVLAGMSWPTLSWRRRRQKLVYFWSAKKGLGPPSLTSKIPPALSDHCSYSFRSPHLLQIPRSKTARRMSSFISSSCILWNSLPPSVASTSQSISSFKARLDLFFSPDKFSFSLPK